MSEFKKYQRSGGHHRAFGPFIRISRPDTQRTSVMSKKLYDEMNSPEAVELYYNKKTGEIGMKKCVLTTPFSLKVTERKIPNCNAYQYVVCMIGFVNQFEIKLPEGGPSVKVEMAPDRGKHLFRGKIPKTIQ